MRTQSFSSINLFDTCARQYELQYVKKVMPFTESVESKWGNDVHAALETYLKGGGLGERYKQFKPYADKVLSLPGAKAYEWKLALKNDLTPTDFEDQTAWIRGIIDVCVIDGTRAAAFDWKTGKIRPDSDQLKLFAAFVFEHFKDVQSVKTVYVWLGHGKTTKETYTREQLPGIWAHFMAKVKRIEQAYERDKWIPKPSGLCNGWCGAGRANCEFWSPRR